ncbi:ACP S-malonyltransferase [Candidatus Protochlamydia phocaeensis]|uniref:ACP S-malonyltransferase n=1 Tax=Candidatus Protochlamydia phocaeensis TaxID=1414722 RepID=UPI0008382158|nr:ACP S-malonyltransferase [Candidatus Protochlamydia phocaeensis]
MDKKSYRRIAFIFPGQGAQYPGMVQDFVNNFSAARLALEEADDLLKRSLSSLILNGPEDLLTQTRNSQAGIYVASMAIWRVVQELHDLKPFACAGLSLGEYSALTAGEWLPFRHALPLVDHRGEFMNAACEETKGTMAVVVGLENAVVEDCVKEVNLPHDLWIANYNCPGQIVLSGTMKGIEAGSEAVKARGAKRVLPLQVHGAFHSGLMRPAEERLAPFIESVPLEKGSSQLVMNVPGDFVQDLPAVRRNLIKQVTSSVRWEQGIRAMDKQGVDLFIEFGPGKTLAGMNKRMGINAQTITIEKVEDLDILTKLEKEGELE